MALLKSRARARVAFLLGCGALGWTSLPSPLAAAPHAANRTGYTLAFVDADVKHVVDAVLGDMLHATYTIDPKVAGTVTLRTATPVDRAGLIPLLEEALAPIGAVLVDEGGSYHVVPRDAARAGAAMVEGGAGYGSEVVHLRYANPTEIARLIGEFVGKDVVSSVDPAYDRLVVTGTSEQRAEAMALVQRFDVDALAGSTFQLIHLDNVDADALNDELKQIFKPPLDIIGSRVRLVPLPRLHSMLVIAAEPQDIARVEPWIERLDQGGASNKRRLYSYVVQNGRARDLAASLQAVLGQGSGMAEGAPTPRTAAGAETQAILDTSAPQGMTMDASMPMGSPLTPPSLNPAQAIGPETPLPDAATPALPQGAAAGGSDKGPRIVPVDSTNSLLIYANGEDYDFIRQALADLDKPVPQVLIEATLAEVTLTKDLQYGLNWSVLSGNSTFTLSNTAGATPAASFPGFSYAYLGKSVQAVLNTLQSKTQVRVLSAPKLMVLNNQTATLQVGDEVPIVTQQAESVATTGAPLVNTVELRDTGVILKVTPRVNDSGQVTLDIAQEVSDVVPTTTSDINSPTIEQRRLTSTIATRSGQMVALGGLIRENVSRGRSGLPILSQIPIVGGLFGQHTTNGERTELIILLTPVVMKTPDDAHSAVDDLLSRMNGVRPVLNDAVDPAPVRAPKR